MKWIQALDILNNERLSFDSQSEVSRPDLWALAAFNVHPIARARIGSQEARARYKWHAVGTQLHPDRNNAHDDETTFS